jgi:hypothetical protein
MPIWDAQPITTDQQCWDSINLHSDSVSASTEQTFRDAYDWVEVRELQDQNNAVFLAGLLPDPNWPGASYVAGFYDQTRSASWISPGAE